MAAWTYQPVEPARAVPAPSGWEQAVQFDPFEAYGEAVRQRSRGSF